MHAAYRSGFVSGSFPATVLPSIMSALVSPLSRDQVFGAGTPVPKQFIHKQLSPSEKEEKGRKTRETSKAKREREQKGRKRTQKAKRPSAFAEGLPCFNTCGYLAPDGGVFSSGSLAASDPTYLMVLRGVSIVMIASPVAVKRLMPNV